MAASVDLRFSRFYGVVDRILTFTICWVLWYDNRLRLRLSENVVETTMVSLSRKRRIVEGTWPSA